MSGLREARASHGKKAKKTTINWKVVLVVIASLAILGGAYYYFTLPSSPPSIPPPTNGGSEATPTPLPFYLEGSHKCAAGGVEYLLSEGTVAYVEEGNVVLVYGENRYVGMPDGKWVKSVAESLDYGAFTCEESAEAGAAIIPLLEGNSSTIGGIEVTGKAELQRLLYETLLI